MDENCKNNCGSSEGTAVNDDKRWLAIQLQDRNRKLTFTSDHDNYTHNYVVMAHHVSHVRPPASYH